MFPTVRFFSNTIFKYKKNTLKILLGAVLDTLGSISNTLVPMLFVTKIDKQEEMSTTDIIILGSAIITARIMPKLRAMLLTTISANVQKELTLQMIAKCFDLELDQHLTTPSGQFSEAISRNYITVDKIAPVVFGDLMSFAIDAIAITTVLGVQYDTVSAFPPVIFLSFFAIAACVESCLANARKELSNTRSNAFGMLMQAIGSYSLAHQFGNVKYELQKINPIMNKTEELYVKTFLISNTVGLFQTLVNYLGFGGTFFYAAFRYRVGDFTSTDFAFISYLMSQFCFKLDTLTASLSTLHSAHSDAQKIIQFCKRESKVADVENAPTLNLYAAPSITFQGVKFSYPPTEPDLPPVVALDDVSFTVNAGETVALVGETGAGKSTIIQLILRFYHCHAGSILINGIDIATVTQESLLSYIAVVSQEAGLFNNTVLENIKYGNLQAQEHEIKEVADSAGFLESKDYDYVIQRLAKQAGENGKKLSGGEKQRVAIARALLRGGLVLLLDESTSALDPKTEKSVQDKLDTISKGATTLIVTHKLYTLTHTNKIIYLEKGKIVESGTFTELVNQKGKFYAQLQVQCNSLGINIDEIQPDDKHENNPPRTTATQLTIVNNWAKRDRAKMVVEAVNNHYDPVPVDDSSDNNLNKPLLSSTPPKYLTLNR